MLLYVTYRYSVFQSFPPVLSESLFCQISTKHMTGWTFIRLWFATVFSLTTNSVAQINNFEECMQMELLSNRGVAFMTSVFYNDNIYSFGGKTVDSTVDKSIRRYFLQDTNNPCNDLNASNTSSWEIIGNATTGFLSYYGAELDKSHNILYFFGMGIHNHSNINNEENSENETVWKYDFKYNVLNETTGISIPNNGYSYSTAYDSNRGFIYLLGGRDLSTGFLMSSGSFLQVFDIATQSFLVINSNNSTNNSNDNNNNDNNNNMSFVQLKDYIDFSGNNIKTRVYGKCVYDELKDKIYYFGGSNDNDDNYTLNTILVYDISNGLWYELNNTMMVDRMNFEVIKIDRDVWIFGGYSTSQASSLQSIEVFNLDTEKAEYARSGDTGDQIVLSNKKDGVSGKLFISHDQLI